MARNLLGEGALQQVPRKLVWKLGKKPEKIVGIIQVIQWVNSGQFNSGNSI